MKKFHLWIGMVICVCPLSFSQAIGEFTGQVSVGTDYYSGSATFSNGKYEVLGSGNDIWDSADGFYYIYKEITGSFVATVDMAWGNQEIPGGDPKAGNEWKKMGIMVRDTPANAADEAGARYVFAMLRNDLGCDLQYRLEANTGAANSGLRGKNSDETDTMQLIRIGNMFIGLRKLKDGTFRQIGSIELPDTPAKILLGFAVTAHDTNNIERAFFSNFTFKAIPIGVSVNRGISVSSIDTGGSIKDVKLSVTVESGKTADAKIIEKIPAGWTASDLKPRKGTANVDANGVITWDLTGASGSDIALTYNVASPKGPIGPAYWSGSVTVGADETPISGILTVTVLPAPGAGFGVLEKSEDIFNTETVEGDGRYDPLTQTYVIIGSGHDIWDAADDFHFVYKEVSGKVSLKCTVKLEPGEGDGTWAKAGAMIRDELDPASSYGFAMIRAQGRDFAPQWRDTFGGSANWNENHVVYGGTGADQQSGTIEITRDDTAIGFNYYDAASGARVEYDSHDVTEMTDPVYVGLVVTSHRTGYTSSAVFTNVVLKVGDISDVGDWYLY